METIGKIIPFIQSWYSLPDISLVSDLPKPVAPNLNEELVVEYTEAALRQMILSAEGLFYGMEIDANSLANVPDGWVSAWYLNLRYRAEVPNNMIPLRADNVFPTTPHCLAGYICMSALLKKLHDVYYDTVDPAMKAKADAVLRLLRQVNYCIWTILKANPTGGNNGRLVIAAATEIRTVGNVSEQTYTVYLDESRFDAYVNAGGSMQSALDYWVANKQQPPMN